MKDAIILKKVKEKEKLSKNIIDKTILAKVARVSNLIDLDGRYK